jgi:hypothetical protein
MIDELFIEVFTRIEFRVASVEQCSRLTLINLIQQCGFFPPTASILDKWSGAIKVIDFPFPCGEALGTLRGKQLIVSREAKIFSHRSFTLSVFLFFHHFLSIDLHQVKTALIMSLTGFRLIGKTLSEGRE